MQSNVVQNYNMPNRFVEYVLTTMNRSQATPIVSVRKNKLET